MAEKKKLNPVDLAGIGSLLGYLVAADNITCEERDKIMLRIAKKNGLAEYVLHGFAGYGQSKDDVSKHIAHKKASAPQGKEQGESNWYRLQTRKIWRNLCTPDDCLRVCLLACAGI